MIVPALPEEKGFDRVLRDLQTVQELMAVEAKVWDEIDGIRNVRRREIIHALLEANADLENEQRGSVINLYVISFFLLSIHVVQAQWH